MVKVSRKPIFVEILTKIKTFNTIKEEQLFVWREGKYGMSTHEIELFKIISESKNPEQAVLTAIKVFSAFLEQLEANPMLPLGDLQVSS